ncbi:MAG: PD40 domain-containing protein [Chroococcidiopsidaceae cyanobacterium CP_BM_ER_R8_30]|nr:PD40 domain-containing protein [Chroococcidiopsidaceae cyanobacterium CP_BM_ER_R8_30]
MTSLVVACSPTNYLDNPTYLNSRYNDEQPALSGNGRFLAFVSNRYGNRSILLYDLQQQQLIPLPGLNQRNTIAENPSLSYTGRYLVYVIGIQGQPTVALYDRATQQSQLLTQFYPGWVRHPSISPNGRYVVFEGSSRGQWSIEVLDRGPNIELDIPDSVLPGTSAAPSP